MRKWFGMIILTLLVGACGTFSSFQWQLDGFPIDPNKNYIVWRFGSVELDKSAVFCKVDTEGRFEDCQSDKNSNNNKLFVSFFGSPRVVFKYKNEHFLIINSQNTRSGKYAFVYGSSGNAYGQRKRVLRLEDATYVGDFAPGTVTVIPFGWENRHSAAGLKKTVEAGMRQAFGKKADVLKVGVAQKVPVKCDTISHGFWKGSETTCQVK
ncbi:hypothetical protein [Pseudovibrio sp. Alg231-02]|uniref:hypothetical protein n=1 Tax=Pseudovibrio sp. Alg231-02 TaxID=1922223 RepID=UPI001AD8FD6D|nr:hypothetical protein [Pseudovibrio sp. Alg231-02]